MKQTNQLRDDATRAREDLVGTVGEFVTALTEVKADAVAKTKAAVPKAGAVIGGLILLRILFGLLRRR